MNKIKDVLYDTNDILVALIILCLAGALIYTRVDAILSYPERTFAEQESGGHIRIGEPVDPTGPGANGGQADANNGDPGANGDPDEPELYSLYIAPDQPMHEIAQALISLEFFITEADFYDALDLYEADRWIHFGNFIIPSNATTEELIDILTSPGL